MEVGGDGFWDFVKNNKGSYAFVHNHNSPANFSETDLLTLSADNCINMFVISRYDGTISVIESNGIIRPTPFFDTLYSKELDEINLKVRRGEYTPGERTYYRETLIVENAIRDFTKGLIEFE